MHLTKYCLIVGVLLKLMIRMQYAAQAATVLWLGVFLALQAVLS